MKRRNGINKSNTHTFAKFNSNLDINPHERLRSRNREIFNLIMDGPDCLSYAFFYIYNSYLMIDINGTASGRADVATTLLRPLIFLSISQLNELRDPKSGVTETGSSYTLISNLGAFRVGVTKR